MSGITVKTTGQLLDEFWTTMMRCWAAQEKIMDINLSDEDRLMWAIRAQEQNAKRTELIRALDERLPGPGITNSSKTYHSYFEDKK